MGRTAIPLRRATSVFLTKHSSTSAPPPTPACRTAIQSGRQKEIPAFPSAENSKIYALCLDGSQRPTVPMFGGLTPLEELHRLSPERFDLWESMLYPEPEPSNPRFEITAIDYSPADTMLTLTWDSIPGEVYAIKYSSDPVSWEGNLDDAIDAASDAAETSRSFDLASLGLANREKLFFTVEKQ